MHSKQPLSFLAGNVYRKLNVSLACRSRLLCIVSLSSMVQIKGLARLRSQDLLKACHIPLPSPRDMLVGAVLPSRWSNGRMCIR